MKKMILAACIAALPLSYSSAEGYQVNSLSARQSGMGHVGTAMKLGAESVHFNPAGLGFLNKTLDLSVGFTGVSTKMKYNDSKGYTAETNSPISTPFYVYGGFQIYDNLVAGFGFFTPYGSTVEWPDNWKGAHLVQNIQLKAFCFQPTLSYRVLDNLSFGAGLMINYGNFNLSRALMPVGTLYYLLGDPAYADVVPAQVYLEGSTDLAFGVNVGVMWDINEKFTLGVSYRSKVEVKVPEGEAKVSYASDAIEHVLTGKIPPLDKGTFKTSLPLPSNLNIGLTFRPTDRLLLSADWQMVGWGTYDELNITFSESVLGGYNITNPKEYKNSCAYRLGAEYKLTDRFDLRGGMYYDQSPVEDEYLNPETSSMDKLAFSTGFTFRPVKRLSVNTSFTYINSMGGRDGSFTDKLAGEFGGHYKTSAFLVSLGLGYSF